MTTIVVEEIYRPSNQVRNERKYAPECGLTWPADIVSATNSYSLTARYVPESRPMPADKTSSLTSRPRVYERSGHRGEYQHSTIFPCGHNGLHWYEHLSGMTGVMTTYSQFGYDLDTLKAQNMWAIKLRQDIVKKKVNLGSSLAEYRESVKMFMSAAHGIHDAWKTLRGRMPRRKIRACSIPASVLQYNFGVAPLVGDLYSSVETLRHRMEHPIIRRSSVSVKRKTGASGLYNGVFEANVKGTFKQRATIYYNVNPGQTLDPDFDFGNPAEWAWELIPFSFVVDWAIPIGDWLGTLDALMGVSGIRGTVTTKTEESGTYFPRGYNRIIRPGKLVSRTYERDVINTVPLPPFPRWSPNASYKRLINAAALLGTINKRCSSGK